MVSEIFDFEVGSIYVVRKKVVEDQQKKWWRISKKISPSENNATYGPSSRMIFSSGTECGNNSKFLSITVLVCLLDFHAELQKVEVLGILNSGTKVNKMLYGVYQATIDNYNLGF